MPFTVKNWEDSPSTATPLSATALEDLETRLSNYANGLSVPMLIGRATGVLSTGWGTGGGPWQFPTVGGTQGTPGSYLGGLFHWLAADYAATGRTTQIRLRMVLFTNTIAPAGNFTAGLSLVGASGGGNDATAIAYGSHVSGTTVTRTAPTASSKSVDTVDFTPPADGTYLPTVQNSAAIATNSRVEFHMLVYVFHL